MVPAINMQKIYLTFNLFCSRNKDLFYKFENLYYFRLLVFIEEEMFCCTNHRKTWNISKPYDNMIIAIVTAYEWKVRESGNHIY